MDNSYNIIILTKKMYYNYYDTLEGNGFYPQIEILGSHMCNNINIDFKLFHYANDVFGWQQCSGPVIYGFTKKNGQALLNYLNIEAGTHAQMIKNCAARTIFPMTYNSTYYVLENYSK